jgi:ABC-type branched-subunit amino acid transport system substrate-binding protein
MKKRVSIKMVAGIMCTIVLLILLGINTNADAAKPEKFTFYLTGDLSGPMGPLNVAMIPALSDFCKWYNSTKGGIRGVPIDFMARDNTGDVSKGVAAYEYFRLQKPKPVVGSFHPAFVGEAIKDRLKEDKIVNFFNTASNPINLPVGWLVGSCPSYPSSVAATLAWVKEKYWKDKYMKVAFLTWDNSYGKGIFDPELRKWFAKQPGMDLVAEEVFSPRDIDVSTPIIRLKNKGVNWIVDNTLGNGPVIINKSLKSLGLLSQDLTDTSAGKIHRATNVWGIDDAVVRLGGSDVNGLIGLRPWASYSEKDNPGIQLLLKLLKENKRDKKIQTICYILKFAKMVLVTHIVEELVDEKGWEGVTGDNFLYKLLRTENFNALELCDFTYAPDYPFLKRGKVYIVQNGNILPASGHLELPDLRPPQYR